MKIDELLSRRRGLTLPERLFSRLPSGLAYALFALLAVIAIGTLGYHFIEDWSFADALYMTVITMATIGYGEVHPLSPSGRTFTIFLIFVSVATAGYAISVIGAFIIEGELYQAIRGRRMDRRITSLTNHVIICGGGHVGKYVVEECHKTGTPFVVIEQDQDALDSLATTVDLLHLQGDATEDETLRMAGIERARGLVATLGDDRDNVFITLTARSLNPKLRIVGRVIEEKNAEKLRKAGADEVVSTNAIGGLRIASVMLRPAVVTFLDEMLRVPGQTLRVEEVHVHADSWLADKSLAEADIRQRTGMLVLAIKPRTAGHQFNPDPHIILRSGDILFVMGTPEQVKALHDMKMA